jgi:Ethanolamine utilization protein EutJ (predicted chaperonin)
MNPNLSELLIRTNEVMNGGSKIWQPNQELISPLGDYRGTLHTGVDLGTAYTVLIVLNEDYQPVAGTYQFAQVVRDGLVVDFVGAVALLRNLKKLVETKLGFELKSAASSFPPGVAQAEVRATANILHAAGLDCTGLIDEPTAANNVLQIDDVAIVMEKVGNIISRHIKGHKIKKIYLVGGTCAYPEMDKVIQEYTGIETILPGNPLFVTPLGIAMHN